MVELFMVLLLLRGELLISIIGAFCAQIALLGLSMLLIYEMDKLEYGHNEQACIEFKRRQFYIIQKSKRRHIISKKTFILELIQYAIFLLVIIVTAAAFIIGDIVAIIVIFVMGIIVIGDLCVIAFLNTKTRKKYYIINE